MGTGNLFDRLMSIRKEIARQVTAVVQSNINWNETFYDTEEEKALRSLVNVPDSELSKILDTDFYMEIRPSHLNEESVNIRFRDFIGAYSGEITLPADFLFINRSSDEITRWCNQEWEKVKAAKKVAKECIEEQKRAEEEARIAIEKKHLVELINRYPDFSFKVLTGENESK